MFTYANNYDKIILKYEVTLMGSKLNNKGFTLVELLAVMLILITISLVSVAGVTSSLTKRDVKECQEQQELAVSAAKIYFSLTGGTSVTIAQLNGGAAPDYTDYFKDDKKIDRLKPTDIISVSGTNYLYNGDQVGASCS